MALPARQRDDELIARHIEVEPGFLSPDRARLSDYGVSVVALITHLRAVDWDIDRVADAYDLPVDAVVAGRAYYERHASVIDARIALNTAAFTGAPV